MVNESEKTNLESLQQQLLDALDLVELHTSKLLNIENILEQFCRDIEKLGFDYANISLISYEQDTVESVHGIGIGKQWSSLCRHYLEKDPELRDIQADIIENRRTEIISGWDKRFDRWIYKNYEHEKIVRVFTPILLVKDDDSRLIEDWFEHLRLETIDFQPEANGKTQGKRKIYQMRLAEDWQPEGHKPEFIVIGTVEAGYNSSDRDIEYEKLEELLKCIANRSLHIKDVPPVPVFEAFAEIVRKSLNADAATLHFLYEPNPPQGRYIYEVCSGKVGKQFLKACPPRNDGLGRRAIQEKKYKFISNEFNDHENSTIAEFNPKAFEVGIQAMVAFPLLLDGKEGVIYVLFQHQHEFSESKLDWVNKFVVPLALNAISYSSRIQKMRNEIRWQALHSITQTLSRIPEVSNVLSLIACNTLNILGADVVNIYEYVQTEKRFITPPETGGQLTKEQMMSETNISELELNSLFSLINDGKNVYVSCLEEEIIFKIISFISRERIKSTAGILLRSNQEIFGLMLINYRRLHSFNEDEKNLIENLAYSTAIAIQNHRWFKSREKLNRADHLASPLVHRLNSDVGAIRSLAQDTIDRGDEFSQSKANEMLVIADRIIEKIDDMVSVISKKLQPVDLHSVLHTTLTQMNNYPKIALRVDVPENLPPIFGIEQQFIGIFDNLIQNAVEAMSQQGVLSITITLVQRDVGNWIQVTVRDTGIGIQADNLERIFELGYTTKKETRRMGFGLWWTKSIVELFLNGHLDVQSVPEQGATFTLLLPVYQMPAAEL